MVPDASQVRELCTDLKFIAKIGEDEKIHVGSQSLQPAKSWWTVLVRLIQREDQKISLKYIRDKTDRAIAYCDQILSDRADTDSRDLLDMLRDDLEDCVVSGRKHGLEELHKTYAAKHKSTAELEEIIRYVRMKLAKYTVSVGATKRTTQAIRPRSLPESTPFATPLSQREPAGETPTLFSLSASPTKD
jgi:hypothetical protein